MQKLKTHCLLLITALIWGSAFVAQSVGMDYVGPFTFNGIRNIIGGITLLPCIALLNCLNGRRAAAARQDGGKLLWGGVCCGAALFVGSSLQQFGIMYTSVGKAGFITALYIVIVPLLGIMLKKHVPLLVWLSVAVATVGMYFMCITEELSLGRGDALVLVSAVAFSLHILVIDYFSPQVDCVKMAAIQFFVCGLLSAVGMFVSERPTLDGVMAAWLPLLYAGVLSCGVAYTLQIVAQRDTDPAVASLILSLESVFALLTGWLLLDQSFTTQELVGAALVFSAVLMAQWPAGKTGQ